MVDFLFAMIELFRYILQLRRYKRKSVKSAFFEGVSHFERKLQMEGGVAHQALLVRKLE